MDDQTFTQFCFGKTKTPHHEMLILTNRQGVRILRKYNLVNNRNL